MVSLQPRALDDAPKGIWLLASAVREEIVPATGRYPHICGIEIDDKHKWWARDCAACWNAGWRPRYWEESLRKARLAAAAALIDPTADPGSAPPPPKEEKP